MSAGPATGPGGEGGSGAGQQLLAERAHSRAGRDGFLEVMPRYRYSVEVLARATAPIPKGTSRETVALVHSAVAGVLLASWSKTWEQVPWPTWQVALLVGLDPKEDAPTSEKHGPGNGLRGKAHRHRVRLALKYLATVGAITYAPGWSRLGHPVARVGLPELPPGWADRAHLELVPGEEGSQDATPRLASRDPARSHHANPEVAPCDPEVGTTRPLTDKDEEKRASEQSDARQLEAAASKSTGSSAAVSGREAASGPAAPAGKSSSAEGSELARWLAPLIPAAVEKHYPHGRMNLAAEAVNHAAEKHRPAISRLETYRTAGAAETVRAHLEQRAAKHRGDILTAPGLVLAWCSDLPEKPVMPTTLERVEVTLATEEDHANLGSILERNPGRRILWCRCRVEGCGRHGGESSFFTHAGFTDDLERELRGAFQSEALIIERKA